MRKRLVSSPIHFGQRAKDLGRIFVFLDMLAERIVAKLHVGEFILILDEESTTVIAIGNGDVGNHIFIVPLRKVRAEVAHILNEDFFLSHTCHNFSTNTYWCIIVGVCLVRSFEQTLSEQIVFNSLVMIVHR